MGLSPNFYFKLKFTKVLEIILESSGPKRRVVLDQTQCFRANHDDKILIWAHLLKMLTKVKLRPQFES